MQIHSYESVIIMNEAHLHWGDAIIALVTWRNASKGVFLWVFSEPQEVRIMLLLYCIKRVSFCLSQKFAGTELMRKQHKAVKEGRCWASRSSYGPAGYAATTAVNQPVVCCGWNCCRLESHGKVRALTLAIRGNETRTLGQREGSLVSIVWPCECS